MKIRNRLTLTLSFSNGEAERVQEFHRIHPTKQKDVYLKGIEELEKEVK